MTCAVVQCHLWLAAVAAVLVAMTTHHQADATWPPSGGMPMYECCCRDNPACGGCFRCRQNEYTCYCNTCSCYSEERDVSRHPSMINLLEDNTFDNDGELTGCRNDWAICV